MCCKLCVCVCVFETEFVCLCSCLSYYFMFSLELKKPVEESVTKHLVERTEGAPKKGIEWRQNACARLLMAVPDYLLTFMYAKPTALFFSLQLNTYNMSVLNQKIFWFLPCLGVLFVYCVILRFFMYFLWLSLIVCP